MATWCATEFTEIGGTEPQCPYCCADLPRWPERRTRCRNCDRFIFVRKRPLDGFRVLLREDQLPELEAEWRLDYEIKSRLPRELSPEWQGRLKRDQEFQERHPILALAGMVMFAIRFWLRRR